MQIPEETIKDILKQSGGFTNRLRLDTATHLVNMILLNKEYMEDIMLLSQVYKQLSEDLNISYKAAEGRVRSIRKSLEARNKKYTIMSHVPYKRMTVFENEMTLLGLAYYVKDAYTEAA